MAYVIGDGCFKCGNSAANCPVEAITVVDDEYVIDENTCISCGTCAAGCPVEVISEE